MKDKKLIRNLKMYRENFKRKADRHEKLAKEYRDVQRICENIIKEEDKK